MITKVDEGGVVATIDVKNYIIEAESQLKNKDNYNRLKYDPTETHNRLVNDTTERFKKQPIIKEKFAQGLKTEYPRTPKFYLRSKIRKKENTGRPVVSSVRCHTSNISKNVDYHLQPMAKEIPFYVKDTNDCIQKLNQIEEVPEDS